MGTVAKGQTVARLNLAWWSGTLAEFRASDDEIIVGKLSSRLIEARFTSRAEHVLAWRQMLPVMRQATLAMSPNWRVLFEFPMLRLVRRIDVVLVSDRAIFVFEFKSRVFGLAARRQAEDYALDLRDFHAGSRHHPIVPVVVAQNGRPKQANWPLFWSTYDNPVLEALAEELPETLETVLARIEHRGIAVKEWEEAAYRPVPTIVEAAWMLYQKHGVDNIRTARADLTNLTRTTEAILQAVKDAKANNSFIIVFVTGIPGAGKTLCGLDVVFSVETQAAFLTGTLPMVYVLKEALAQDAAGSRKSKRQADHETKGPIQSITNFLKHYRDSTEVPAEHVVVFDEAQRAWDASYGARKFGLADSEAGIILDIMRRHLDFAVIVGLVGTGQEINTGEAGLHEWGASLSKRIEWQVRAPPNIINSSSKRQCLYQIAPPSLILDEALHLAVPVRQIRSTAAAPWVDALLRGDATEAAAIAAQAEGGIPFFLVRSLSELRETLRARSRGMRRAGLVCSSGAKRLVADGLWPRFDHVDADTVANWFLKQWPDVRASDALEIPATEFACQGLELDYVGLCWGGDWLWRGRWIIRNFVGTKWQLPPRPDAIEFCRNKYRVLLTRARYDTVIWVPQGEARDATREPALFDETAEFLLHCGAKPIVVAPTPASDAAEQSSLSKILEESLTTVAPNNRYDN